MPFLSGRLADLRVRLRAQAAGIWRVDGPSLVALAFDADPEMPPGVAAGFAAATARVSLDRRELGVVAAVVAGRRVVSIAAELSPDAGSGYWLRAFGASRSVAVPIAGAEGSIAGVVSVALAAAGGEDDEIEAAIRAEVAAWTSEDRGDAL